MSARNEYIKDYSTDARWFLALKKIKRPLLLNSYTISVNILEIEKEKVINDNSYNPVFEYQSLDGKLVQQSYDELSNLREQLWQEESSLSIRDAYIDKIDEALLEMKILSATNESRWSDFMSLNREKYGDIPNNIISDKISLLQRRHGLFTEIELPPVKRAVAPKVGTIDQAKDIFTSGPTLIGEMDFYEAENIRKLWQEKISEFSTGWKVLVSDKVLYIKVDSRHRIVFIPPHAKMSEIKMRALFVHEVGTHIYRRELGKKTRLQLLSIGLANYQKAEEGIAIVREQLVDERYARYGGFDKYLTLAYALGTVDGKMKDFQQTFTMLKEYYAKRLMKKYSKEDVKRIALDRAWGSSVRVFRGGNPALPGCCLRRDKIYHEGSLYIWELIEKSPEYFKDVYIGKFDPGNEKHRNLVSEFK